jgi:hypothetical protein
MRRSKPARRSRARLTSLARRRLLTLTRTPSRLKDNLAPKAKAASAHAVVVAAAGDAAEALAAMVAAAQPRVQAAVAQAQEAAEPRSRSDELEMALIDAGDYDGDGKSELVFALSGYNYGGYQIFYDGLKKSATFDFSYH